MEEVFEKRSSLGQLLQWFHNADASLSRAVMLHLGPRTLCRTILYSAQSHAEEVIQLS